MGLRGMYQEAIASSTADLEQILQSYESILASDPMNVVRKRYTDLAHVVTDCSRQY